MNRAVFLDRDGTLIEDKDYLHRPEDVVIFPGVGPALKRLQDAGFKLFIVTNQSGVGRGYFPIEDVHEVHEFLCRELAKDGVRIAMARVGQGPPLVRPPTWFNHLEYDWHVQFRGALYRFLAERAQLIRYDGRSNGLSDRYVPGVSFELLQSDLEAVVDALHL